MATDIRSSSLKEPIEVAEYLFRRLHEVGIRSIHGVPGDYNLVALDFIEKTGLSWVGNCNELNAGYAADGYARVKGMGAIVTTFGVGELSAINAIAGAYSEVVPVVHIVGTPSTLSQRDGMLLHHTLGNGNFEVFADMNKDITCATAKLTDAQDAAQLIDHAIRECWIRSRPVYITLPTDIVLKKVEGERLKTKLDLDLPANAPEVEDYVANIILESLRKAKKPAILVDACAIRHRAVKETHDLIVKSNLPTFVTPMGKGAVDESLPNYSGVYAGSGSSADVAERFESADLVLTIGAIKSDFNTAGFTSRSSPLASIDFHSTYTRVRYAEYPGVCMHGLLANLVTRLEPLDVLPGPAVSNTIPEHIRDISRSQIITHEWFWPRVGQWLREGDVIITETGTANFGIWSTKFPPGVVALSQVLWGSIGYAVGACQGAALAVSEMEWKGKLGGRRTLLFVGDGSFQLTVQEVSTMIRKGLKPIIFIICNEGYTIERFIHGMHATYNDIQPWQHSHLLDLFGASPAHPARTYQLRSRADVDALFLHDDAFSAAEDAIQLVELFMPKEDVPLALKLTAEASARVNARL